MSGLNLQPAFLHVESYPKLNPQHQYRASERNAPYLLAVGHLSACLSPTLTNNPPSPPPPPPPAGAPWITSAVLGILDTGEAEDRLPLDVIAALQGSLASIALSLAWVTRLLWFTPRDGAALASEHLQNVKVHLLTLRQQAQLRPADAGFSTGAFIVRALLEDLLPRLGLPLDNSPELSPNGEIGALQPAPHSMHATLSPNLNTDGDKQMRNEDTHQVPLPLCHHAMQGKAEASSPPAFQHVAAGDHKPGIERQGTASDKTAAVQSCGELDGREEAEEPAPGALVQPEAEADGDAGLGPLDSHDATREPASGAPGRPQAPASADLGLRGVEEMLLMDQRILQLCCPQLDAARQALQVDPLPNTPNLDHLITLITVTLSNTICCPQQNSQRPGCLLRGNALPASTQVESLL